MPTSPDLLSQLNSDNLDEIRASVVTLGELRALAAVSRLLDLLHTSDTPLRLSVIEALGRIGDSKTLENLANALADRQADIRAAAAAAIGNLGVADVVELLERPMHSDSSVNVRCACARALGVVGTAEAVDVLVASLVNSDEVLLACITEVLEGLGYTLE